MSDDEENAANAPRESRAVKEKENVYDVRIWNFLRGVARHTATAASRLLDGPSC